MISLTLPSNQNFMDPGVITLTEEGLVMVYTDGEEVQLTDSDGDLLDCWEEETENFIKKVFSKMIDM